MKRWAPAIAAAAIVAAIMVALVWLRPEPVGRATGQRIQRIPKDALDVWLALQPLQNAYLSAWSDRFAEGPQDSLEVLAGFHELAAGITGFGGLWRKTVPDEYFGCAAEPESPVCRRIAAAEKNFARWDRLQTAILELETEREARRFLAQNGKALREYIDHYVPADRSLSAVQATPFFAEQIAPALR